MQAVRFLRNGLAQFVPFRRIKRRVFLQETAGSPSNRRQGRAQVVRHGTEQGVPQPFGGDLDLGLLGFSGQGGAFNAQSGLIGKGLEQMELLRSPQAAWRGGTYPKD